MDLPNKNVEEVEIDMSQPDPKVHAVNADNFWHDKEGRFVVLQMPNKNIIAWFVFFVLSELIHVKPFRMILGWVAFMLLAIWAVREIRGGANYFRKSLGLLVFLLALLTRF